MGNCINISMPRPATHHQLRHHHNLLLLCILALFVVLGILAFKYIWVKQEWRGNTVQLQNGIQKQQTAEAIEEAYIVGMTITTVPPGVSMWKLPLVMQNYIVDLGKQTGRDIVVLDKNKKILADTTPANVGQTYSYDTNGEIASTMQDGTPRSFNEKSTDFPNGIMEEVVQLKDSKGTVLGAILISSSNLLN